jgi:hypothetical protein
MSGPNEILYLDPVRTGVKRADIPKARVASDTSTKIRTGERVPLAVGLTLRFSRGFFHSMSVMRMRFGCLLILADKNNRRTAEIALAWFADMPGRGLCGSYVGGGQTSCISCGSCLMHMRVVPRKDAPRRCMKRIVKTNNLGDCVGNKTDRRAGVRNDYPWD